jgi:hypothetical protein
MKDPNQRAFVARVTRPDTSGVAGRTTLFYAVLADTRELALAAIREAAQPGDYVEMNQGKLSPETARALDLQPGQPRVM